MSGGLQPILQAGSQLTLCWREADSNHRFREAAIAALSQLA